MASEFIETMQKLEETARLLSKMGPVSLDEAVSRIRTISDFINRYGDIGPITEHLKERSGVKILHAEGNDDTG